MPQIFTTSQTARTQCLRTDRYNHIRLSARISKVNTNEKLTQTNSWKT